VRNLAEAIVQKRLDFAQIEALPAPDAVRELIQLKGIGPWTAEIYLMFCAAHPDIFPSGDLALQKAVHHAFALEARPDVKTLNGLAERWAPHRATAALLFWRYYAAMGMNSGVLL
jgi:DNA-3-methyladenine glycosylase II